MERLMLFLTKFMKNLKNLEVLMFNILKNRICGHIETFIVFLRALPQWQKK